MGHPDCIGKVMNFTMESNIDNDGIRYFAFDLLVYPLPSPPNTPQQPVFYINPHRDFAARCAGEAFVSWGRQSLVAVFLDHADPAAMRVREVRPVTETAEGIPPDPYPAGQKGTLYAGTTSFDRQMGGDHIRYAEIRGGGGLDVLSLNVAVIPPAGAPPVPLSHVQIGAVNIEQPQIAVAIQTPDSSAIIDGYVCQFAFVSAVRPEKYKQSQRR